jgi:hypothetical protein
VNRSVLFALTFLPVPVVLAGACTQDFDQFEPNGNGGGGAGGAGGTAGSGAGGPECLITAECNDQNPCTVDSCEAEVCVHTPEPTMLAPGYIDIEDDCVEDRCEGGELVLDAPDDSEVPDNLNPCVVLSCVSGEVATENVAEGTACGNGLTCDGAGVCSGCTDATQCPGMDDECQARTCDANGDCGLDLTAQGTPVSTQTDNDCQLTVCDGAGMTEQQNDDTDPPLDGGPCLIPGCDNGTPIQTPEAQLTACGGGNVCTSNGMCVECVTDAQCTSPETCAGGGVANQCGCDPDPTPCATQSASCGSVSDGCGGTVQCGNAGACVSGGDVCQGNTCCTPMSPCTGNNCGSVNDNCGQAVTCNCAGGSDICQTGTCCTPDADPCGMAGAECGSVVDNCGQTVNCTDTCVVPDVCQGTTCCTPMGLAAACAAAGNAECGDVPDGCGGTVGPCGSCPPGQPMCIGGQCTN